MGATFGISCPCLGRHKPLALESNASGGGEGYGWCVRQNQRERMEDAVEVDVAGPQGSRLFAVYDGHGGLEAVAHVKQELPTMLNQGEEEVEAKLQASFEKLDEELKHVGLSQKGSRPWSSGVVATVALWQGPQVVIANLGDCRALVSRGGVVEALTTDHRPEEPLERSRLAGLGLEAAEVLEHLAVSRALGDFDLEGRKCPGLSARPELSVLQLDAATEFLLLASDGLFEHMDCKEVGVTVRRYLRRSQSPQVACERIVEQAMKLGSTDNISAVLIAFRMPEAENTKSALRRKVVLDGL